MARCSLCTKELLEGGTDIHQLNRNYEIPKKIVWDGTRCTLTNEVISSICSRCLNKIMNAVNSCINGD